MEKIYIDVKYFFLDLGRRIKNLWRWLPIIWNDRDWDDSFIFEILKFKLKNTADYIEQREWFVGYEHEVSRMRLCVKLIERVQEEWYGMEYFDYHTSTFEFIPTENKDENGDPYYTMHSEIIEDNLDGYFKKYPLIYKRVVAKLGSDSDRTLIALYMGRKNHERAKRLLFNILNEHIENWWD
jgi:hypothetical protein